MGIFGGGSTTYYNTSTMPLYDEDVAGMLKQTIVSATAANRSVSSTLLENILNSNAARLEGLYRYAASGHYQWGLPDEVEKSISVKTLDLLKMVITEEQGEPVVITHALFDNNPNISLDVGKEWTIPSTPHIPNTTSQPSSTTRAQNGYDWYYIVEYQKPDAEDPNQYFQWWFKERDATPAHYAFLLQETATTNPYYPIIPFRVNGERWDNDALYEKDIRRACHYLGLNSTTLGDSIQKISDDSTANGTANPLEEAYVHLGVPLNTPKQIGKEYLFKYFKNLISTAKVTEGTYLQWLGSTSMQNGAVVPPRNSIIIKDVNFENTLSWSYIKQTRVVGNLQDDTGKKLKANTYTTEHVSRPRITISDIEQYVGDYFSNSSIYYRKQLAGGVYIQVEVRGLGFSSNVVGKETYYTSEEAFEPEDVDQDAEKVVAPLHKDVFKSMGRVKGHDLINIAARMQLNDKFRVKHKTNWFAIIVQIVSIVVTVFFPPAGAAMNVWARIGINIAITLVMKALMPVITSILQDVFGEELGAVLAVVAAVLITQQVTNAINAAGSAATAVTTGTDVAVAAIDTAGITLTTFQLVNLTMDVVGAYQRATFTKEMGKYTEIADGLEKETAELAKLNDLVGFDDISGIVVASQLQDTNKILSTNLYVQNIMNEARQDDILIRSTQDYTEAMRFLGRVYSPINSARILA